jgi:hypothetical protein
MDDRLPETEYTAQQAAVDLLDISLKSDAPLLRRHHAHLVLVNQPFQPVASFSLVALALQPALCAARAA